MNEHFDLGYLYRSSRRYVRTLAPSPMPAFVMTPIVYVGTLIALVILKPPMQVAMPVFLASGLPTLLYGAHLAGNPLSQARLAIARVTCEPLVTGWRLALRIPADPDYWLDPEDDAAFTGHVIHARLTVRAGELRGVDTANLHTIPVLVVGGKPLTSLSRAVEHSLTPSFVQLFVPRHEDEPPPPLSIECVVPIQYWNEEVDGTS